MILVTTLLFNPIAYNVGLNQYVKADAADTDIITTDFASAEEEDGLVHLTKTKNDTELLRIDVDKKNGVMYITGDTRENITSIDTNEFNGLKSWCQSYLKTVNIQNNGNYKIAVGCFTGCRLLQKVDIGFANLTEIGYMAFYDCSALKTLAYYKDEENFLLTDQGTISIQNKTSISNCAFGLSGIEKLDISNMTDITIGDAAFEDCTLLNKVNCDNAEVTFGYKTFYNCTALNEISLNNTNIIKFGYEDFGNCTALTDVTLNIHNITMPDNEFAMEKMETSAWQNDFKNTPYGLFYNCKNLKNVKVISEDAETLYPAMFYNCNALSKIDLTEMVALKDFNYEAFANCTSLNKESITLPDIEMENLGYNTFYNCKLFTNIDLSDWKFKLVGGFKNNENLESVIIPEYVTQINNYAFEGCSKLKKAILPENVKAIGKKAFSNTAIDILRIPYNCINVDTTAFQNFDGYVIILRDSLKF